MLSSPFARPASLQSRAPWHRTATVATAPAITPHASLDLHRDRVAAAILPAAALAAAPPVGAFPTVGDPAIDWTVPHVPAFVRGKRTR